MWNKIICFFIGHTWLHSNAEVAPARKRRCLRCNRREYTLGDITTLEGSLNVYEYTWRKDDTQ